MPFHVIIEKPVRVAIRAIGLSRTAVVLFYTNLHHELKYNAAQHRQRRSPTDPDFFIFRLTVADGNYWHTCELAVNDARANGYLFVEAFRHRSDPIPP